MPTVSLPPWHFADGVLTVDVLFRLVHSTLLNPSWTILLLLRALARSTGVLSARSVPAAVELLGQTDWVAVGSERGLLAAAGLFAVGVGVRANEMLNRAARNNFTRTKRAWNWKNGGEVVLITGGAGGLGSEVARWLASRGIKVVILDVAPLSFDAPPTLKHYTVDISSRQAVFEVAKRVVAEVGHPTVLLNLAGVVRTQAVLDMSEKDVDMTYDINVKAHYYTAQAFVPHMVKAGHGHVVTVASAMSYVTATMGVAYCSSKAAALSFHEGLTEELRHLYQPTSHARAVRTSIVCPAHFKSDMFAGFENAIPECLAPSLEVGTVAELVVRTVLSGESQHIVEPFYCKLTPFARALPTWLYGSILFLAKDAMGAVKKYKDKQGKAA
ncbi:hypothetical protein JCM10207_000511 [Rhodosporidiobolus poonsookiae]